MTSVSRSEQFAKVHKVLKKHYKASACNAGRTVIEHLLFACCLEDARYEPAEEAFAAVQHTRTTRLPHDAKDWELHDYLRRFGCYLVARARASARTAARGFANVLVG